MSFHIGQKVVCVDTRGCYDRPKVRLPSAIREGEIYTLAWIGDFEGVLCVRLVGIKRDHPTEPDVPFRASRFRPLVTRKTDIGIFTEILRKVGGRVDA